MTPTTASPFALPDALAATSDPALIAADEAHFAAIAASLEHALADLTTRLAGARRTPGGSGQEALDRDQEVHRLSARLRTLRRFGLDAGTGEGAGVRPGGARRPRLLRRGDHGRGGQVRRHDARATQELVVLGGR